jgi:energy-coupling factor transporter transmembrane protein EcfT
MAARALLTPGSVLVPMVGLTVTAEGLAAGALIGWRLLAVVFLGLIFASTSRPKEIRAAVEKLLAPVPFIPEKQLATMLGLIVRFIPLVFDQAHETIDALKARGLENRKNPIYRLRRLGLPLLRRTILEADQLSLAMEARCFSFQRTVPRLVATGKDWLALLMVGAFCGLLIGSAVLQV